MKIPRDLYQTMRVEKDILLSKKARSCIVGFYFNRTDIQAQP